MSIEYQSFGLCTDHLLIKKVQIMEFLQSIEAIASIAASLIAIITFVSVRKRAHRKKNNILDLEKHLRKVFHDEVEDQTKSLEPDRRINPQIVDLFISALRDFDATIEKKLYQIVSLCLTLGLITSFVLASQKKIEFHIGKILFVGYFCSMPYALLITPCYYYWRYIQGKMLKVKLKKCNISSLELMMLNDLIKKYEWKDAYTEKMIKNIVQQL